jgi:hypothetical protein
LILCVFRELVVLACEPLFGTLGAFMEVNRLEKLEIKLGVLQVFLTSLFYPNKVNNDEKCLVDRRTFLSTQQCKDFTRKSQSQLCLCWH